MAHDRQAVADSAIGQATPGPWEVFICDDGGQWSGWPLSVNAVNDPDKCVVRPGGQYPYEWDAAMSQREAVANARLISAAPDMLRELRGAPCPGGGYGGSQPEDEYPSVEACLKANACGCSLGAAVRKAEGR